MADLAARQHGVVRLAQLRELGLSPSAVRSRVAVGRLHRLHRGVYAVGHPRLTVHGRWMAAVLACGRGAVLSHRSAAALWGIRPTSRGAIEVTVSHRIRARAGVEVHESRALTPVDVTTKHSIPCTTVARTLLDLATLLTRRALERALEQAEILELLDIRAVEDILDRATGLHGTPLLAHALSDLDPDQGSTRSDLEDRFLALCRRAELPKPQVNAWVTLGNDAVEADFLWRRERLIVETDGRRVHGTRHAFERDRHRDQRLLLAGWRVVRFTWLQITRDPDDVAATVTALLGGRPR